MSGLEAIELAFAKAAAGDSAGVLALVFWLSGIACLGSTVYQLRLRRWPVARGRLLKAGTRLFGPASADVSARDYVHDVVYEYSVGGVRYEGTRVSSWVVVASHNARGILAAQLGDLEAGDELEVIHSPSRPERAYLKRPPVVGILVTLVCAALAFYLPLRVLSGS